MYWAEEMVKGHTFRFKSRIALRWHGSFREMFLRHPLEVMSVLHRPLTKHLVVVLCSDAHVFPKPLLVLTCTLASPAGSMSYSYHWYGITVLLLEHAVYSSVTVASIPELAYMQLQ